MDKTEKYQKYIQSEDWKKKREDALYFYGDVCSKCGNKNNLNVHHKNYDMEYGQENMTDLMVVCEDCHNELHQDIEFFDNPETMRRCPECNQEMIKITDGFKCFQCGIEVFPRIR